ncbi:hypothetical protein DFH09DRAFT_561126 [Mycena vulgaris]|nr:hypothetical protein DFH09DRAFT_561126 [Mycena vulgaris]
MHWPCSLLLLLLAALGGVRANTEIQNFPASLRPSAPQLYLHAQGWPVVRPRTTQAWTLAPSPAHELWLALSLDHDESEHAKYTLRLSWAASSPTDFEITILDPSAAASVLLLPPAPAHDLGSVTLARTKYARIRARDAGVRTPSRNATIPPPATVTVIITLEPLLLGVLPATLLPFLLVAAPVLALVGALLLPAVQGYVAGLVREARRELEGRDGKRA